MAKGLNYSKSIKKLTTKEILAKIVQVEAYMHTTDLLKDDFKGGNKICFRGLHIIGVLYLEDIHKELDLRNKAAESKVTTKVTPNIH